MSGEWLKLFVSVVYKFVSSKFSETIFFFVFEVDFVQQAEIENSKTKTNESGENSQQRSCLFF